MILLAILLALPPSPSALRERWGDIYRLEAEFVEYVQDLISPDTTVFRGRLDFMPPAYLNLFVWYPDTQSIIVKNDTAFLSSQEGVDTLAFEDIAIPPVHRLLLPTDTLWDIAQCDTPYYYRIKSKVPFPYTVVILVDSLSLLPIKLHIQGESGESIRYYFSKARAVWY